MLAVPHTLAIADGDHPVVGRALQVLLEGAGYKVRSLAHPLDGNLGQLLEGVHLLLLPPSLSSKARGALLDSIAETPELAALPIVALTPHGAEAAHGAGGLVGDLPWPSRIEALVEHIQAVLSNH